MEAVFVVVLVVLSVLGAVDIVRKITFWLAKPLEELRVTAVITDKSQAENTVRALIQRIRWMELKTSVRLILIDKSGQDETKEIIGKLIEKFPSVALLSAEEMQYNNNI